MKKLFIIPLFLILLSCADDSSNTENIEVTTPLVSENALILGVNQVNYDKNKTFNTLIYQARNPVNEDYQIKNSYNISANGQQVQGVKPSRPAFLKKFDVTKGSIESINELNRNIQQYAYDNNIKPIDKNSTILKRTMPQTVEVGTKWENVYLLDINSNKYYIINATCIAVSDHAYFFLQDNLDNLTDEQITAITTAFDKDYEIMHQYYGEETDTDGNGKVSFLIANFSQGLFGFFTSVDKYAPQDIREEEDGKGGFAESYVCDADGRLEYTWSCVPESVSDGAAFTEDYIQNSGWTAASVTLNEDVAADLGMDAYEYTAYEDDNGYSMLHRGVLIADDDNYYTADFRMMEGDMGQYETSVQEWLSSLYLA